MTYQINIKPAQEKTVLQLLQSLVEVGFVESIEVAESLAVEGEQISDDDLVSILEQRRQEIKAGQSLTNRDVVNLIHNSKKIIKKSAISASSVSSAFPLW